MRTFKPRSLPGEFLRAILEERDDSRVRERADISEFRGGDGRFSASLRRMRRMIFPDRVLGSPSENWMRSGVAMGPISLRTIALSPAASSSEGVSPSLRTT